MISFSEVTMRFGSRLLFEDVTWRLHPGTHYGLVGANGTGKSTVIRLMTGELGPETGEISRPNGLRLGVLPQDHFRYDALPLLDTVMMGKPRMWEALAEKERLLADGEGANGQGLSEKDGHRLGELEAVIADEGGYTAESSAATLLEGLGFGVAQHRRPMGEQSGGYRLRVLLAQTLFGEPELLALDEPTNHLDIVSIRWLEGYLRAFAGTVVLVSHDRHFLNGVCDHIADLDYQQLRHYPGNYDAFLQAKELAEVQKKKEIVRTEKKIAEMQQFIDRFRAKATKARQAQSRQKQVERMTLPEVRRSSRRFPSLRFVPIRASGREVLAVRAIGKAFLGKTVLRDVAFEVARGDKLAVVGPNGIGKSTLLTLIAGHLKPDGGEIEMGYEVQTGYFAQEDTSLRKGKATVYEWLHAASPNKEIGAVRATLGRALFSGDEADKPLGALSGGESTRLRLAALMMSGDNLLLLDEPTNHLDLEGREALRKALIDYTGTLIFVSHDRHFVSSVATRVLALTPDGLEDFPGPYEEYLARQGADFLAPQTPTTLRQPRNGGKKRRPPPLDFEARKASKRQTGRLRRQVEKLEKQIALLEKELQVIARESAAKATQANEPWQELQAREKTRRQTQHRLDQAVASWETAAKELEQAEQAG